MATFADGYLGNADAVIHRVEGTSQALRGLQSLVQQFHRMQRAHSEKVLGLLRSVGEKKLLGCGELEGSVRAATECLLAEMQKVCEADILICEKLMALEKDIEQNAKENEKMEKQVAADCVKSMAKYKKMQTVHEKAEKTFKGAEETYKKQSEALEGAKDGANVADLTKKANAAKEKMERARRECADARSKVESERKALEDGELPVHLLRFQGMEEVKIAYFQECISKCLGSFSELSNVFSSATYNLESSVNAVNAPNDIRLFVEKGLRKDTSDAEEAKEQPEEATVAVNVSLDPEEQTPETKTGEEETPAEPAKEENDAGIDISDD